MEYQQFIDEVKSLQFIEDEDTADAAVKAVLGILASRIDEPEARKLSEDLPEPLSYEKLRGMQANPTAVSASGYCEEVRQQFKITHENACTLVNTILHLTKDAVKKETLSEVEKSLPSDWVTTLQQA